MADLSMIREALAATELDGKTLGEQLEVAFNDDRPWRDWCAELLDLLDAQS